VIPDIICSSKGIASGMPLSAVIARAEVMDWKPGAHASTFGGNPVCMAAALATLDLVQSELMANAAAMGRLIMERIASWPERFASVGDVRGRGLMVAVELVQDKTTKTPAPALRERLVQEAFHRGLLLLGCGESTIRLTPALTIGESDVNLGMGILEDLLQ